MQSGCSSVDGARLIGEEARASQVRNSTSRLPYDYERLTATHSRLAMTRGTSTALRRLGISSGHTKLRNGDCFQWALFIKTGGREFGAVGVH
ncbi:hypothetical protein ACLOJK_030077 [Asimina triloba]